MTSLDTTCRNQVIEIEATIERLGSILRNKRIGSRRDAVKHYRDCCIVDLYEMQKSHASYDERRREALADGTGQDGDVFNFGECSGGRSQFNEAGEQRW